METALKNKFDYLIIITLIFGITSWTVNILYYTLSFFSSVSIIHSTVFLSIIYSVLSLLSSFYSIKRKSQTYIVLGFLHWIAVLLLTLPLTLEIVGIMKPTENVNTVYHTMLTVINAPLFGLTWIFPFVAMPVTIVLFSVIQTCILFKGVCNLKS